MFGNALAPFAIALATITSVAANHAVSFHNNCGKQIRPIIKNTAKGVTYTGPWLAKGGSSSNSVPENWASGIMFGQTNANQALVAHVSSAILLARDITIATCRACRDLLSVWASHGRPEGAKVLLVFCLSKTTSCPPSDAWVPNKDDGSSLRFCNVANVGLKVTFCP
ncbi:hypothetical protein FRC10_007310 [Ceratobasidium sp. 414]|nr:hypothetical protein FRC10_007310 [Ceratobasidium sp. 414]